MDNCVLKPRNVDGSMGGCKLPGKKILFCRECTRPEGHRPPCSCIAGTNFVVVHTPRGQTAGGRADVRTPNLSGAPQLGFRCVGGKSGLSDPGYAGFAIKAQL